MSSPPFVTTCKPMPKAILDDFLALLACQDECVFLESGRTTAEDYQSYFFCAPKARLTCASAADLPGFLAEAQHWLDQGYYLAGWLAYELGYLLEPVLAACSANDGSNLASLGVYPPPYIFDHRTGAFTSREPVPRGAPVAPAEYRLSDLRLNMERPEYIAAIERIKRYIAGGDTYQVNFTLKYTFSVQGSCEALYRALRHSQSVSFAAYLKCGEKRILSFSPELFFRKLGETCTVKPMKGTMHRGRTPAEDEMLAARLREDSKNRSENVMIVDLLRNDLGRLCQMGGVQVDSLFDVETYETLQQLTSTIRGQLRPAISLSDLLRALFPSGSVTGAPKIRTMEIIRALEKEVRGPYTGGIGFLAPNGDSIFSVPIRTVVLNGDKGEMGIGSGIVADSDPVAEWEECLLKGRFLVSPRPDFQLIETMLWQPERGYKLLELHLDRLASSAAFFGYRCDRQRIAEALQKAASHFDPTGDRRVRLLLSADGAILLSDAELRPLLPTDHRDGLPQICISATATDSSSPFLYHKTTLREFYDREREAAVQQGFFEVLFTNERGEVTEGSITNVFIEQGGQFRTPPVESGLLNGVFRRDFLFRHPETLVEPLFAKDLATADAVYVANSVRGMIRVEVVA